MVDATNFVMLTGKQKEDVRPNIGKKRKVHLYSHDGNIHTFLSLVVNYPALGFSRLYTRGLDR